MQACALAGAMTPVARRPAGPLAPRRAQLRLARIGTFRKQQKAAQRAVCVAALEVSPCPRLAWRIVRVPLSEVHDKAVGPCTRASGPAGDLLPCRRRQPPWQVGARRAANQAAALRARPACPPLAEPLQV